MKQIWALTRAVLIESFRKQFLFVLVAAFVAIVAVPYILGGQTVESTLRVSISWSLAVISLFGLVIVLFLAGTSLPREIRSGHLQLLVTKPVNRLQVVLSRFFGYSILLGIFVLLTGLVMVGSLRITQSVMGGSQPSEDEDSEPVLIARQTLEPDSFRFERLTARDQTVYRGRVVEDPTWEEGERLMISARQGTDHVAQWTFDNPVQEGTSGNTRELHMTLEGSASGQRRGFRVRIRVQGLVERARHEHDGSGSSSEQNAQAGPPEESTPQEQMQSTEMERVAEEQFLVDVESGQDISRTLPEIPAAVDQLRVLVGPTSPTVDMQFYRGSVHLSESGYGFEWNLTRALLLIYFMFLVLIAFIVSITTLISGPIAICAGLLFYATASAYEFLERALQTVQRTLDVSRIEDPGHVHLQPDEFPSWLLEYSNFVLENVMAVIPNFSMFRADGELIDGWLIQNELLINAGGDALLFCTLFLVAGCIFIYFREIN